MQQLHAIMDLHLQERHERIGKAITNGDTTTLWKLITASAEAAFIDTLALPDEVKQELKALSPASYIGNAKAQAEALNQRLAAL